MKEALQPVLEHLAAFYPYYVFGALILLPFLFFTRRWTIPLIAYGAELIIYFSAMHVLMHVLVILARWFKENSSMRALREDGKPIDAPEWTTPLLNFWESVQYNPAFLFYVELVFVVLIFVLVLRLRPLKIQRVRKARYNAAGQKITKGSATAHKSGSGPRNPKGLDPY